MDRRESERKRLEELACPETDALVTPGVLLSDEIERLVKQFKLIDPFNPKNLKPAGYELTVGEEYAIGGKIGKLYDEAGKNEVKIPPFEVLVIQTKETLNMPRFLIARWNIRVMWAYEGLLWVGGPQVDPGYVGHLFCPIYNLSDKEVTLRLGDQVALIDFVTTTPFNKGASREYEHRPPKRVVLEDYGAAKLRSALFTEAAKRIDKVEDEVSRFGARLDWGIGIIFTAIAALVAALTIFVSSQQGGLETFPLWFYFSAVISVVALSFSIVAWRRTRPPNYPSQRQDVMEKIIGLERMFKIGGVGLIVIGLAIIWLTLKILG